MKNKQHIEEWSAREINSRINWLCVAWFVVGLILGVVGMLLFLMRINKI